MSTFTPGQVGAASVPDAHTSRQAPAAALEVDQLGDDVTLENDAITAGGIRAFRSVATGSPASGQRQIETTGDALANVHAGRGSRDRRRTDEDERGNWAGEIGHEATPETFTNARHDLDVAHETPPARPRQGFTGADPHRVAWQRRPLLDRLFDKGIAEHPGAVDKIPQEAPRARVSRVVEDVANPRPAPGGWTGTAKAGMGLARGTFRTVPGQWAELLVSGAPATVAAPVAAPTAQHARGFRR